jgi:hypothetical protein
VFGSWDLTVIWLQSATSTDGKFLVRTSGSIGLLPTNRPGQPRWP